ncbi:hypothetical protein DYB37_004368 [Aphanomyces astaci]|uniref:Uncharacterized protein n=1 Tax=Aphanomyces astaci TaxID=112090 RepID=A0A3R7F3B7_APHAT|nr:hypothetical protein DYB35_003654 [Aphanomyces astaci]RHZ22803.1 hypothetical protein DYB37_004368 [Aphanomyces astaci]
MQLDLSRKGFAYIPEDLDEHVTSLSLSANRICSLSDVGRLVHLRRVDLSCNKIVALAGIEVLGALVWLNLSRNSITSLDGVQHLAHLQTLDVADNNLTDIDVLEHNMSLTHVNASTNCINVSQAVAEPPLAHSSTFLPHHDTPGTHASSAKTGSATSRQDLHKALAAVQDHVQHMRKYMKWKRANYSARQIQRVWRGYVVRGNLVGYVPGIHDTVVNMEICRKGGATLLHQVRCVLIRVGKLERQAGIQDEATMALWSQLKQAATDSHNHHRLTRAVSRLQVNEYIHM